MYLQLNNLTSLFGLTDETLHHSHKIWNLSSSYFLRYLVIISNKIRRFFQILWPSQNIQTLFNNRSVNSNWLCPNWDRFNVTQGRHGRQGSQGLVLEWILRNRKWRAGEIAATMASLPTKNLPWRTCICFE